MDFNLTNEQLLQKIVDAPRQWYGRRVLNIAIRLNTEEVKMPKLDELKVKLIEYSRTKDIALAGEICKWLHKELIKQPKKIEVKEG